MTKDFQNTINGLLQTWDQEVIEETKRIVADLNKTLHEMQKAYDISEQEIQQLTDDFLKALALLTQVSHKRIEQIQQYFVQKLEEAQKDQPSIH